LHRGAAIPPPFREEARRIAANIAKLPERVAGKSKFLAVNNKT
jgi:hypothetical protein